MRVSYKTKEFAMGTVKINGMSCQHCVMAVKKALGGIEGIKDVQVDLKNGMATFTEEKAVGPERIAEAIRKAGFEIG
jgi:copper chaperone